MSRSVLNTAASLGAYSVSLGIGLAYTPFLVKSLGPAAYGLVPLTFALVQYLGFLVQTVSATTGQRLIANLKDPLTYNRVFSTTLVACAVLAGIVVIIGIGIAWGAPAILQIPDGLEIEAQWLIAAGIGAFATIILLNPFNAALFSHHALYVNSLVDSFQAIIRVMLVVALFLLLTPSLFYVSVGIVVAPLVGAVLLIPIARHFQPTLRFTPRTIEPELVRAMSKTAGGVLIAQFGTVLLFNSELIMMNLIYGPELGGIYAATMQWAVVLRGLGLSLAANATARVMFTYHHGDQTQLIEVTARYMRLLCVFIALPAGVIAGVAPDLLLVWLGPEFAVSAPILAALAIPVAINLASIPLGSIMLAADRTYHTGLCYMTTAIAFIALAPVAAQMFPLDGLEIALVLGTVLLAKNWIFMVPFAARLTGPGALGPFLIASLMPILWVAASFVIAKALAGYLVVESFLDLAFVGLISIVPYAVVALISLPKSDVRILLNVCRQLFSMLHGRTKRDPSQ